MHAEFVAEPLVKDTALTKLEVSLAPTTICPVSPLKEILPLIVPPDKGKYPETVGISVIKANLVLPEVVPTLAYPSLSINKYFLEL